MNQSMNSTNFDGNSLANDIWAMMGEAANNPTIAPTENIVSLEENQIENAHDLATEILSKLEQKKDTAAAHLGISAAEVETMPFDLTAPDHFFLFV